MRADEEKLSSLYFFKGSRKFECVSTTNATLTPDDQQENINSSPNPVIGGEKNTTNQRTELRLNEALIGHLRVESKQIIIYIIYTHNSTK